MKKIIFVILIYICMSGCTPTIKKIICEPTEKAKLSLEDPLPLDLKKIKWIVITEDNVDEVFQSFKDNNKRVVVFAVSGDGYKALALNMQEIKRYLSEQKEVLRLYREYYESDE